MQVPVAEDARILLCVDVGCLDGEYLSIKFAND